MTSSMHFFMRSMWRTSMSYQYVYPSPELMDPCGATRYRILPQGVMKVVTCLSLMSRGMLWKPFQASDVYLKVFGGTPIACLKGASVTWVCLVVAALTALRSTTRRGAPVFLPTTCILLHHVVGVLEGTLSITPRAMSRSSSRRTSSTQCAGIVDGRCIATGSDPSLTCILKGGKPDIKGKGWCGQTLNADAAYVSRNHFSISGTFSGVKSHGGTVVGGGGGKRFKHPHSANSLPSLSYFWHCT